MELLRPPFFLAVVEVAPVIQDADVLGSTGFVTFTTLTAATAAAKLNLSHKAFSLETTRAPEPRGLLWENVMVGLKLASTRKLVAKVMLNAGAMVFAGAVASLAVLANPRDAGLITDQDGQWRQTR